ncbi:Neutral ceramidase [Mycena venus]|uniref:Neutral ceramidase n=1 Tax=Mycena venus TaxID=2733690 RepID=A0A8H7CEA4_9AGAR|nr:Neutral ceramidase [Mycena venus]
MAGRRIREAIRAQLISSGILGEDAHVVIAGTANTYIWAYIDKYTSLVPFLADGAPSSGEKPPSDPALKEQISKAISMQTDVKFDAAPFGKHFGQAVQDVRTTAPYHAGGQSLRGLLDNLRLEGTFLAVDRLDSGVWVMVRSDSHPSTVYQWEKESTDDRERYTRCVPFCIQLSPLYSDLISVLSILAGTYQLRYFGDSKPLAGAISAFVGSSSDLTVVAQ